ncbi:MAG: hypothetical protein V4617_02690 [Gemmatimonadota bacterium]
MKKLLSSMLMAAMCGPVSISAQISPLVNPVTVEKQRVRTISLYADGNVQSMLESTENTSATGSIGLAIQNPYVFAALHVTAAGTMENVTEAFGGRVLSAGGGGSFSGFGADLRWLPRKWLDLWYGGRTYVQGSSSNWVSGTQSVSAPLVAAGLLATLEYRDSLGVDNPVSVMADIGIARRQIRGNIAQSTNDSFREAILGTRQTGWTGMEAALTIQVHQISARGAYYHFGGNINGLSKGQIVTSISVKSAIFSDRR